MNASRISPPLVVIAGLLLAVPAMAAEKSWNASVYASTEYDDNIAREGSETKSDVVYSVGATVGGGLRTDRHTLTAAYDLSKDYYRQNSFKDRTNLTGSFGLRSMLWEQRAYWVLNHSRSTALTSGRLRDTPDNREERSSWSTGPQLYFRPTERDSLNYSALYSTTELEESSENENYNISHNANWSRVLSDVTNFNLSASHTETRFDENKLNNYDRSSASLGFSGSRPWFNYSISAGRNKVTPRVGDDVWGSIFSLNLSRSDYGLNYYLSASRSLTDTVSASTNEDQIAPLDPLLETNVGTVSIIERTSVSVGVSGIELTDRITSSASLSRQDSTSEDEGNIDQQIQRATVNLNYTASERVSYFTSASYSETDYLEEPVRTDKSRILSAGVNYGSPRGISASFSVNHENRSSDDSDFDYSVLSAVAKISYLFGRE
jgi:hypothetical protein